MYTISAPHIRRAKLLLRLFVVSAIGLVLVCAFMMKNSSVSDMTEVAKCPACYGTDFCATIESGGVHLYPFLSWFNAKNVFFGRTTSGQKVTLKKLGHNHELDELDTFVCRLMGQPTECRLSEVVWRLDDVQTAIFNTVRSNLSLRSGISFCPVVDPKQIDDLVDRVARHSKQTAYKTLLINVLTMFVLNPEPVILQAFPAEDGWPFPKYLGSCGRVTAQEYVGSNLGYYLNSEWRTRARLALQLLKIAQRLTFHDQHFSLYLTDVTAENLAVDAHGTLKVVDLGNVIIVDKNPPLSARPEGWKEKHSSDIMEECENCFSYSQEDICGHRTSDHNYYAACQFLSSSGWLRDPPEDVRRAYPQLPELLRECAEPQREQGRYRAVRQLIPVLANVTLAAAI
ncbi:divergent protein kinase domain 2A [Neocloeon triangulifer]|uniref:divergent protein kinase domain 2A n=1 Tax=Neocloeon triangulifer TaxID=2078957 RepID=UPI00286F73A4|nr:divergent protein kinase domain 2A [Neocloeon triangulifer]XP_059483037.1 divergent protein kinase domain 2A [Neocloeon triangulifer]